MFPFALGKASALGNPGERTLVVEEVDDDLDAWTRLASESFDLVVTEFHLPLSNCQELLQKIRAHDRTQKTPVIVVGEDSDEAHQAAFSAKADMFLGTPINLVQLFKSLQALLRLDATE